MWGICLFFVKMLMFVPCASPTMFWYESTICGVEEVNHQFRVCTCVLSKTSLHTFTRTLWILYTWLSLEHMLDSIVKYDFDKLMLWPVLMWQFILVDLVLLFLNIFNSLLGVHFKFVRSSNNIRIFPCLSDSLAT